MLKKTLGLAILVGLGYGAYRLGKVAVETWQEMSEEEQAEMKKSCLNIGAHVGAATASAAVSEAGGHLLKSGIDAAFGN